MSEIAECVPVHRRHRDRLGRDILAGFDVARERTPCALLDRTLGIADERPSAGLRLEASDLAAAALRVRVAHADVPDVAGRAVRAAMDPPAGEQAGADAGADLAEDQVE